MKKIKLSPVMQQCVDFMKANGGKICRIPGGFWVKPGVTKIDAQETWFGLGTVAALVKRGVAEWTGYEHVRSSGWRFEVEATLK